MRPTIAILSLLCCMPITVLAQSARQEKTINLPAGVSVGAASVSRAGKLVAAICSDHVVRVWSAGSGELVRSLGEHNGPRSTVQFSGDGRLLAVSYEIVPYEKGTIKVFDVDSWQVQDDLASLPMFAVAFSPDSRRLASAGDFDAEVWDLTTQKKVATMSPPFGGSGGLSFSPDGRWVATADGDGFVRVYDASTGTLRGTPTEFLLESFAVTFSPDGKSVLVGGIDKTISIIEVGSGKISRTIPKQPGLIWSLDLSADGKEAAAVYNTAERFLDINHLRLWDLDKGTVLADFQKPGLTIQGGAFVGDYYLFIASSANNLTLWSIQ